MIVSLSRTVCLRRWSWVAMALMVALAASGAGPAESLAVTKPNLILVLADDMAWDDCGAYGHETIRTPNIDRLAREGMRFDRAFVTTGSCSPSRASIVTGRYPHNTGAQEPDWPVPADQITFVELLRQAGYWTAAAGQWHLGPAVKDRFDLVREPDLSAPELPSDPAPGADGSETAGRGEVRSGATEWVPTLQARPKDKPFFLWLAALDPHRDYEEKILPHSHDSERVRVPPYLPDLPEVRRDLARYYDAIARLDQYLGLVLDELDRQQATTNTCILFMSDNGRPFPRDKTTLYDGGIRTPWIMRWPAGIPAGTVCSRLVSSVDIAPTFLELGGVAPPRVLEGFSLLPLFQDPQRVIRSYIYAERDWDDYAAFGRAVRSEGFKYIRNYYPDLPNTPPADVVRSPTFRAMQRLRKTGKLNAQQMNCFVKRRPAEELYDLANDPYELNNLAEDKRFGWELRRLRGELTGWQMITRDLPPAFRTPDAYDRETGQPLPEPPQAGPAKGLKVEKPDRP